MEVKSQEFLTARSQGKKWTTDSTQMRYHTEPEAQKQESKMHKEIRLNVKVSQHRGSQIRGKR